jgi:hypothetical protein
MGHTTRIGDSELDRATTAGPEVEGVDVDAPEVKAKVVEPKKKAPAKTSTGAHTK